MATYLHSSRVCLLNYERHLATSGSCGKCHCSSDEKLTQAKFGTIYSTGHMRQNDDVTDGDAIFLKTMFPSRKYTARYLWTKQ